MPTIATLAAQQKTFSRLYVALLFCTSAWLFSTPAVATVTVVASQQCALMQDRHVMAADAPVPCQRLRNVSFRYQDLEGKLHRDGHIVVLDVVAQQVQALFDELLAQRFPLHQAKPMETYWGDDRAAMAANNSSAFNGRPITGGSAWSKHAYGVAIDINPVQNPYIGKNHDGQTIVLPPAARDYLVRTPARSGMSEAVLDIFFRHGFLVWGGSWKEPVDYQHFEIGSRDFIQHLLALPLASAQSAFRDYGRHYANCMARSDASPLPASPQACAKQTRR